MEAIIIIIGGKIIFKFLTFRGHKELFSQNLDSSSKAVFIRTIVPFLLLQFSVGLCSSLQATFYPIEASSKGATASQFGAVFGIIHLSLFMFGKCHNV